MSVWLKQDFVFSRGEKKKERGHNCSHQPVVAGRRVRALERLAADC